MKPLTFSRQTRRLLRLALAEDLGGRDVTADTLIPKSKQGEAVIVAREPGVFSGGPVLRELAQIADPALKVFLPVAEGKRFSKNKRVARLSGSVRSILKVERVALNFLSRLCGVTTLTHHFVRRVGKRPVFILDTRKTTPLWREIEKYAVRSGGGRNHRMGLYDAMLIKENHRRFGDFKALGRWRSRFEIEVRNRKELEAALKLEPRVILFDHFRPSALRRAVRLARKRNPHIILEASGNVTLENVGHYAAMGVDWISVGSLTQSAKPIDLSLLVT